MHSPHWTALSIFLLALTPFTASAIAGDPCAAHFPATPVAEGSLDRLLHSHEINGEAILTELERDPSLRSLLAADAGVQEGYTVREHTVRVFATFAEVCGSHTELSAIDAPGVRLFAILKYALALHDIGKPLAILRSEALSSMIATIVGGLAGGALIPYLGLRNSLFFFGILQGATNLLFYYLAKVGPELPALIAVVAGENLAGGMGTAAYAALLMSLCNKQFTATQYALLTSLMAVPGSLIASSSGFLQSSLGWERYFIFATVIAIPGILMSLRYSKWSENIRMAQGPTEAAKE